jgi:pimeloyl-ACP methyl ester carboxylesterase
MPCARNGDVELYYETFGDTGDPALLLVNGLRSQCINYQEAWCERLAAERFFVIRFDNRDVGLSTKLDDHEPDVARVAVAVARGEAADAPYLLSDMAGDAVAVLDAIGVERAHVMGVSMGGMIVQTLAIEHPDRLLSMTSIMSTTGDPDVGQPSDAARELIMAPPPTDRDAYIAHALLASRTWGSPACYEEERIARTAADAFDRCCHPAGGARQLMAIMASGSRTEALGSVTTPTLVLHGDADALIDPSGGRRTADAVPGARFVLIEGMGHDYPPQYWGRITSLVAEHARATAPS